MPKLIRGSFKAWIDRMPGSEKKLIVIGKAQVPTAGWSASLERANPQGTNPDILLLDLTLTPPKGEAPQVESEVDCRYEEAPPQREYTHVTVRYEGDEVTVEVGETS